jgi:hypothetical protein
MRASRGLRSLAPLDAAIVAHCRSMRHAGRGPLHAGLALRPQLTAAQGFRALAVVGEREREGDAWCWTETLPRRRRGEEQTAMWRPSRQTTGLAATATRCG